MSVNTYSILFSNDQVQSTAFRLQYVEAVNPIKMGMGVQLRNCFGQQC